MDNQQLKDSSLYSNSIIEKIHNGDITSRRQLYAMTNGRTSKKIEWLNEQGLLLPTKLSAEDVIRAIKRFYNEHGRVPTASDMSAGIVGAGQKYYGTWNDTLAEAIGVVNQKRYAHITNSDLLMIIRSYVVCYQRLPNREEFDGTNYPYFEAYFTRFSKHTWSEILGLVNLDGVKYFAQHGWGTIKIYRGVTYLSTEEYIIGKYLTDNNIEFSKEVPYGNCNFVFDFYLPELRCYIEYYGIATKKYHENIEEKRLYYGERTVIEIFKHDNTINKLETEVQRLQSLLAA